MGLARDAQEGLAVVLQLADRVADVVERQVGGALLKAGERLRRPAPRQLLERAHVEVAVVKIPLQLRHLAREKRRSWQMLLPHIGETPGSI